MLRCDAPPFCHKLQTLLFHDFDGGMIIRDEPGCGVQNDLIKSMDLQSGGESRGRRPQSFGLFAPGQLRFIKAGIFKGNRCRIGEGGQKVFISL